AKFDQYVSPPNDGKPDGMVGSKRPLVDGVKFTAVPDASTVKAGLLSGALDAAEVPADLVPELKDKGTIQLIMKRNNGKNLLYI
ncbi:hypothetical protein LJD42_29990, partial [Escherichia coli]|nr:hypothetical protein [Escherichia coli]